jgi:hypothetical protein
MRARLILAAGTAAFALAGSVLAASPAMAACTAPLGGDCADTPVTFTLTGGLLTITAPSSTVTLTQAGALGGTPTVSGNLGNTTVSDLRGTLVNVATVVMTSTDFTVATDTNGDGTIPASDATAYSGAVVGVPTGTAVPTPTLVAPSGQDLQGGSTIFTMASIGSGTATYNPAMSIAVPSTAIADTYDGVVTQTVS